jgi:hypothetical protein
VWQALYAELAPAGLEIVTVALDTDPEAARPFVEAAQATHPSLLDQSLSLVDMFGMTNVPFGLWVDEEGILVRPPEVAFADREDHLARSDTLAKMPEAQRRVVEEMVGNLGDRSRYTRAVRDWVARGAESSWVMAPAEVVERSRPRPPEAARAAAHFELATHLHRAGFGPDAVAQFRLAHELDPENWSYKRQAFSLVDRSWGKVYDRDLLSDLAEVGPEKFYPPLEMEMD